MVEAVVNSAAIQFSTYFNVTMIQWLVFSLLLLYVKALENDSNKETLVHTSLGTIKGSLMESRLGKRIYAFRGIKYAKAPIGERRFQVLRILLSFYL